jgi:hypothetical protein
MMAMIRLARFLKRLWRGPWSSPTDHQLPFSADEFARLLYSRDPADLKILLAGLAAPDASRRPKQRA